MFDKLLKTGFATAAAVAVAASPGAVSAEEFKKTPGYPPSPTNPPPSRVDIANLSRGRDWDFIDQRPVELAQVANQPSNSPPVTPPDLGRYDAGQIAELEMQIRANNRIIKQDDQNSVDRMRQNRDRFQQFLRNRQQSQ
jgi:hypothetical protein